MSLEPLRISRKWLKLMRWAKLSEHVHFLIAIFLLTLLFSGSAENVRAKERNDGERMPDPKYLSIDNSVSDMLAHPSISEFAIHMLPRREDRHSQEKFLNIGRLMPWHSHIRPQSVVDGVNRLIADTEKGSQVFFSFYGNKNRDETGLFYFRGKPGAPFALICPGGGFRYVGSLHEGFPVAQAINAAGFNAFVLQYRTGGEKAACRDLAQAITWIFSNAKNLHISEEGYSVWGGSAGGRMAADLGSFGVKALGGADLPKPICVIVAYTGHNWISQSDPPTFSLVSRDDPIADHQIMEKRIEVLKKEGIAAEILLFDHAGHGFGTGEGTDAQGWISKAINFWKEQLRQAHINVE